MPKTVPFYKMAGAGNDFILVDNRKGAIRQASKAAVRLCDRKFSVGADGLILLEKSKKSDLRMRILNSDGSEAEMCGNGVRCFGLFAGRVKAAKKEFTVETLAGEVGVRVEGVVVRARMVNPKDLTLDLSVPVLNENLTLHSVNTGVPHAVHFTDALESVDVERLGREIRRHARFAPRGTNANFVQLVPGGIEVRTYERGVEGETLACGTGSTASALISSILHGLKSPVTVKTRGGEKLKVYFKKQGSGFSEVYLEGPVRICFEGRIEL